MQCPVCRHENRDGAKFCEECAAPLKRMCVKCGIALRPGAKFCDRCGARVDDSAPHAAAPVEPSHYTPDHLAERIRSAQTALARSATADGERRTITAMFADLKGSTALIEGLDPEEARAMLDPALQIMMDAVHRYEGYVAQALGDGILALFGAPIAHEDHAHRALSAALTLQREMRNHADRLRQQGHAPVQARVGINTGEVVLRSIRKEDLHTDYVPVGHSTHIAARMEQLAAPGAILVTAQTFRLTDGYFDFDALGATPVKGVEEPLAIYELRGIGRSRTRLEVAARRGLSRFVGRASEMAQMQRAWNEAVAGHGQILGVVGDPGLGKSRLFYEFKRKVAQDCGILEAFSISHARASPYLPVIEMLRSYFDIDEYDDERRRREKVTGKLLALDRELEATLPYLFALLAIGAVSREIQDLDPELRRARTVSAVKNVLLRESLERPLVVIFEDLHWIDAETQAFLDTLIEGIAAARVLLLVNYRPEYRHDWGARTYYTQLRLAPLGPADAIEMLDFLIGPGAPLAPLKRGIAERTEGTPFFMEEVVLTLVEEGVLAGERGAYRLARAAHALEIPDSVRAVLAARIDRLQPEEKRVLQQLAIIGREFTADIAYAVVDMPEAALRPLLASLQAREFLYEQPAFPEVEYVFKHALTREVAYRSVLHSRRRELHERTAQAIEKRFAASINDHLGELAHHYAHSENAAKAVTYLRRAGQQAEERAAYVQALAYLEQALERLQSMPESTTRAAQAIALHTEIGSVLLNTAGYAAASVEQHYARAIALCEKSGAAAEDRLVPALAGLFLVYFLRGEQQAAQALADKALAVAHRTNSDSDRLTAHYMLGQSLCGRGEFNSALASQRQVAELYRPAAHRSLASRYGEDPGAVSLSFAAVTLFALGFPDQAARTAQEACRLAQTVAHDGTLAQVLFWSAVVHFERGEYGAMHTDIVRSLEIAARLSLQFIRAFGGSLHGAALVERGESTAGVAQIQQAIVQYRGSGAHYFVPYYLMLLARGEAAAGNIPGALASIEEALIDAERRHEWQYQAELYRMQGDLLLRLPPAGCEARQTLALACFDRALEVARIQQAKSWELRAAISRARLDFERGRQREARALLADVYGWFTEGFATPDLRRAKALLDSWS